MIFIRRGDMQEKRKEKPTAYELLEIIREYIFYVKKNFKMPDEEGEKRQKAAEESTDQLEKALDDNLDGTGDAIIALYGKRFCPIEMNQIES